MKVVRAASKVMMVTDDGRINAPFSFFLNTHNATSAARSGVNPNFLRLAMISSLPKFSATCNARPRTGNLIFFPQGLFSGLLEHSVITDFRIFDIGIDSAGFKDQQNAQLFSLRAVQNIYSPAEGNEGGIKGVPGGIGVQA